jgi:hypothetical protein
MPMERRSARSVARPRKAVLAHPVEPFAGYAGLDRMSSATATCPTETMISLVDPSGKANVRQVSREQRVHVSGIDRTAKWFARGSVQHKPRSRMRENRTSGSEGSRGWQHPRFT